MKKIKIIILLSLILVIGCSGIGTQIYYDDLLTTCHTNSPNQFKYCQCWASCKIQGEGAGSDCHNMCDRDWKDDMIYEVNENG